MTPAGILLSLGLGFASYIAYRCMPEKSDQRPQSPERPQESRNSSDRKSCPSVPEKSDQGPQSPKRPLQSGNSFDQSEPQVKLFVSCSKPHVSSSKTQPPPSPTRLPAFKPTKPVMSSSSEPQTKFVVSSSKPDVSYSKARTSASSTSLPAFIPTLSPSPSDPTTNKSSDYVRVERRAAPIYSVPEDIEDLIKNDIAPGVLKPTKLVMSSSSESHTKFVVSSSKADVSYSKARASSSSTSLPAFKPTLSPSPSDPTTNKSSDYVRVERRSSPIYSVPKDIEDLIKNDIVPGVLKLPLSPSTYVDYFKALLNAEDYYIEKWSKFLLENVELKLEWKKIHGGEEEIHKKLVAFEVDSVPERRPFLLSRDFVFARVAGRRGKRFQGFLYRVVKSTKVLAEFRDDFLCQHHSGQRYDISFSFNRVCLKRAHQAITAAFDPIFCRSFVFPDPASSNRVSASNQIRDGSAQNVAARRILSFRGSPPFLVDGPLVVRRDPSRLTRTGEVVREAVVTLYRKSPETKILICARPNSTLDVLLLSLKGDIPEGDMFRANAAFREIDLVPDDVLPSCLYDEECFNCPPLRELKRYRLILATFLSTFRLRNEGIGTHHFSHIFLVDASSATEPEIMVPLANLARETTSVIVTGRSADGPRWVRSKIGRDNGLSLSYFARLRRSKPYNDCNTDFICHLEED